MESDLEFTICITGLIYDGLVPKAKNFIFYARIKSPGEYCF